MKGVFGLVRKKNQVGNGPRTRIIVRIINITRIRKRERKLVRVLVLLESSSLVDDRCGWVDGGSDCYSLLLFIDCCLAG